MDTIQTSLPKREFDRRIYQVVIQYKKFRGKKKLVVEEWIDDVISTSVTGHITPDGRSNLIATTTQIMGGAKKDQYCGSITPAQVSEEVLFEMLRLFQMKARYLVKHGWVGVFGVDFIVYKDMAGKERVKVTEVNGRYSNSMYLANVMRRLELTDWLGYSRNVKVPIGTDYDEFRIAIELALGESDLTKERVIPLKIGSLHLGEGAVIILTNPAYYPKPVERAEEICQLLVDVWKPVDTMRQTRTYSSDPSLVFA